VLKKKKTELVVVEIIKANKGKFYIIINGQTLGGDDEQGSCIGIRNQRTEVPERVEINSETRGGKIEKKRVLKKSCKDKKGRAEFIEAELTGARQGPVTFGAAEYTSTCESLLSLQSSRGKRKSRLLLIPLKKKGKKEKGGTLLTVVRRSLNQGFRGVIKNEEKYMKGL